jgi:hypothetical protein
MNFEDYDTSLSPATPQVHDGATMAPIGFDLDPESDAAIPGLFEPFMTLMQQQAAAEALDAVASSGPSTAGTPGCVGADLRTKISNALADKMDREILAGEPIVITEERHGATQIAWTKYCCDLQTAAQRYIHAKRESNAAYTEYDEQRRCASARYGEILDLLAELK